MENATNDIDRKQNGILQPLLIDLRQIRMAYAYWKSKKTEDSAVFDLFYRKCLFEGEFIIFAGLEECLKYLEKFSFSECDIEYLKNILEPSVEEEFYDYLKNMTAKDIKLYAIREGTVVFPRVPIMRVEGPLVMVQLLETIFLNLVNYATRTTTNAARYRLAAGKLELYECGLRRAQGPDEGLSASKYFYIGGFDGTSNVLAGKLFNIPVRGSHAHAYITSFSNLDELQTRLLFHKGEQCDKDFVECVIKWKMRVSSLYRKVVLSKISEGELAAFISFAIAFPNGFEALVDTYHVKKSGLGNFCAVALALQEFGYQALGMRLDSGDLSCMSCEARDLFVHISKEYNIPSFKNLTIMAASDINEQTILSLNEQQHSIDSFGIRTHLVTSEDHSSTLGCVYKMVELNNEPRTYLSQDVERVSIPGKKNVFRLYGKTIALLDLMQQAEEDPPKAGERILCRHPFQEAKRAFVVPSKVENLLMLFWKDGHICQSLPTLEEIKENVRNSLQIIRPDIKRILNPTPYKVSVSENLYHSLHSFWLHNAFVGQLS